MARFCMNLIRFEKSLPRGSILNMQSVGEGPARARNIFTKLFKATRLEWLLYYDDDELADAGDKGRKSAVEMLLEVADPEEHPVVTGLVARTQRPHHPPIGDFCPEDGLARNLLDFPWDEPFKVDWCGSGFMMVHRSVFELLEKPYWQKIEQNYMSEDIRFCVMLNDIGIRPTVVPTVQVAHMEGRHIYTLQDFQSYQRMGGIFRWESDPRYYAR